MTPAPSWQLAPMSGFSTPGIRRAFLEWGAHQASTGLVDAEGLAKGDAGSLRRASLDPPAAGQILQLFCAKPEPLKAAVDRGLDLGYKAFELNMGCPAAPLMQRGCGGALLARPELWRSLLKTLREATTCPVGVKCRSGLKAGERAFPGLFQVALDMELNWFSLHPRAAEQEYEGRADWSQLDLLDKQAGIEIRAGGDLKSAQEALIARQQRPWLGAILIGRAAMVKPWIFQELAGCKPSATEKAGMLAEMLRLLAGELDYREGARLLPAYWAMLGLDPRDFSLSRMVDKRTRAQLCAKLEEGLQQGNQQVPEENPFLRQT